MPARTVRLWRTAAASSGSGQTRPSPLPRGCWRSGTGPQAGSGCQPAPRTPPSVTGRSCSGPRARGALPRAASARPAADGAAEGPAWTCHHDHDGGAELHRETDRAGRVQCFQPPGLSRTAGSRLRASSSETQPAAANLKTDGDHGGPLPNRRRSRRDVSSTAAAGPGGTTRWTSRARPVPRRGRGHHGAQGAAVQMSVAADSDASRARGWATAGPTSLARGGWVGGNAPLFSPARDRERASTRSASG